MQIENSPDLDSYREEIDALKQRVIAPEGWVLHWGVERAERLLNHIASLTRERDDEVAKHAATASKLVARLGEHSSLKREVLALIKPILDAEGNEPLSDTQTREMYALEQRLSREARGEETDV